MAFRVNLRENNTEFCFWIPQKWGLCSSYWRFKTSPVTSAVFSTSASLSKSIIKSVLNLRDERGWNKRSTIFSTFRVSHVGGVVDYIFRAFKIALKRLWVWLYSHPTPFVLLRSWFFILWRRLWWCLSKPPFYPGVGHVYRLLGLCDKSSIYLIQL